jgi:hypothetical protein
MHPVEPDVIGVEWDDFLTYFASQWRQGEHVAIVGPTGCGKTTCAVGITGLRKWVLALDAKGGDSTLQKSGYQRVSEWPLPKPVRNAIAEGRPARLVMGFLPRTMPEIANLKTLLRDTVEGVWIDGGWTIEIDEAQIITDRKMMNLGPQIEQLLVAARDKKISVINLFQAPAWVPTATTRQATWVFIFRTRDVGVIKTLAEKIGRDWRTLHTILHTLPEWHCVVAGLDPRDPLIVTAPHEV